MVPIWSPLYLYFFDSNSIEKRHLGWNKHLSYTALLLVLFMPVLNAATSVWDGGGANNNWGNAGNWDSAPSNGDNLDFGGNVRVSNNNNALSSVGNITFLGGADQFTLAGNALTLNNNVRNFSTSEQRLNMNLTLASGTRAFNSDSEDILVYGNISGSGNLQKSGGLELQIFGNNTYTGLTTVNDGRIRLYTADGLGSTSAGTIVKGGGDLIVQGNLTVNESIILGDSSDSTTGQLWIAGSGDSTWAGSVTVNYNSEIRANSPDSSTFTVTSDIDIQNGSRLTFDAGNTGIVHVSGILSESSGTATVRANTDPGLRIRLSGDNTYSGSTTINSGFYQIEHLDALGDTNSDTNTTVGSGATLAINVSAGGTLDNENFTISGDGDGGAGAIDLVASSGDVNITGTVALAADSTIDVSDSADTLTMDNVISGAFALTKTGDGRLLLNDNNTYTGATNVNGGTLQAGVTNVISDNSAVVVAAAGTLDMNDLNDTIGSLAGAGSVMLGTSTLSVGADNTDTTFSGVISETGNLIKVGNGTLTLSGANTYTGDTTIDAGTLRLGASNSLSDSSDMNLSGGTFHTGGFSDTLGSLTMDEDSIIDMGTGNSIINWSLLDETNFSGTLSIYNWSSGKHNAAGNDQLIFADFDGFLHATHGYRIKFYSDDGSTLVGSSGYFIGSSLVAAPEPSTWVGIGMLLGFGVLFEYKRRKIAPVVAEAMTGRRRRRGAEVFNHEYTRINTNIII